MAIVKDDTKKTPDPSPEETATVDNESGAQFVYVNMDGQDVRLPVSWLKERIRDTATNPSTVEDPNAEVYAHKADGSVEKIKKSDLPGYAGTNAPFGFHNDVAITAIYDA